MSRAVPAVATAVAEDMDRVVCPSCHTCDPVMTVDQLARGADWHCERCGQVWNTKRLATASAYATWASGRSLKTPS